MADLSPGATANRLAMATSPYLRQHADNPVDWYEWGPEALERARREDRPVFLSIGYSACHWCHVMAHESFEHPEIAAVLNSCFVNIKVDREERPDLDEIYMQATLALNHGQGGWPMSVWLTPECKPFFAGTYFPPQARYGRPGFRELCEAIARAWKLHRDDIAAQADKLTELVQVGLQPGTAPAAGGGSGTALVDEAAERLAWAFDPVSGGLVSAGTNKFPPSLALDVLMRSAVRRQPESAGRRQFLQLIEVTLDHMAAGGIYDQLGGGIHRYSTDVEWHVPHFEKMLYDQALVSRAYLDAWQLLRKPRHASVVREICDYVLADLRAPGGGFYSARDADSEGVEGRYYVWTRAEVLAALGKDDGELFCAHYDVSESGNWRDPHDPDTPKSVLRALRSYECCCKLFGVPREECAERLRRGRERLLALRAGRVPPARDEKVLVEWNGLMIASLARAGGVLDEPRYLAAAAAAAEFVLTRQRTEGRLRRSWRDGRTSGSAFLADYAALVEGLLELYEATFEPRWLEQAAALNEVVLAHYADAGAGFFATADDHEALIARSRDVRDGAVPSGTATQVMNLLRLAALLGRDDLRVRAARTLDALTSEMQSSPWSTERLLAAQDFAAAGPVELTVGGDLETPAAHALLRPVFETYLPARVLRRAGAPAGPPTVHVCRAGTCGPPVLSAAALQEQLARA